MVCFLNGTKENRWVVKNFIVIYIFIYLHEFYKRNLIKINYYGSVI